jgi:hypothetical protein
MALLFIAVYTYGLYAAIVIGPVWGFYLYELVYFLNPANRWWGNSLPGISYSFIVVAVMMAWTIFKWKEHLNTLKDMPEAKWFLAFFLSYGLATIIAVNPEIHNRFMIHLMKSWVTMYIAYKLIDTERKLELALLFYMVGAAYIGYEAMVVGRNSYGRVEGIGTVDSPEANTIAASIVPIIPLAVYFFWHGSLKTKFLTAICGGLVANGLILINSRGAFLAAMIGFSYFLGAMLFSKYKLPKQRLMVFVIIVCSIVATIRLVDNTFLERIATLQEKSSIESGGSGGRRMNFWLATFDLLRDHPFGAGIYGFETLSPVYLHDESYFVTEYGRKARAVHSVWFQGLSEIGWLGFAAFMMILFTLYRHLKKAKRALVEQHRFQQYYLIIAIEGAMLAYFAASTFINMFRVQIMYWLILFGICAAVITLRLQANDEQSSDKVDNT